MNRDASLTCDFVQDQLALSLDGPLNARTTAALRSHLATCGRCRAVERELVALADELPALSLRSSVPEDLASRILARVPAPAREVSPSSERLRRVHWVELRRVASWGAVFVALWWH